MPLTVEPYNETWRDQFSAAAARLRDAGGDLVGSIDHIGSTSVRDLAAKPVIDIQASVADLATAPTLIGPLTRAGFVHRPHIANDRPPPWEQIDPVEWRKAYFRTGDGVRPRVHVHVREIGRRNHRYALLFRDYLRSSPRARDAYGQFKQRLAEAVGDVSGPGGTGPYLHLKDPMLDLIADAAERWAADTGWRLELGTG